MVNHYATNDDEYYNRSPIAKPKTRRIKRNTINIINHFKINNNTDNNNYYKKLKTENIPQIEMNNYNNYNYKENEVNSKINEEGENNYIKHKKKMSSLRELSNSNKVNQKKRNARFNIANSVDIFPSQSKSTFNERDILNLERKLYNLQKERDLMNNEYFKFPEYPIKKEEINVKRKFEMKLEEMNKEISFQKLKIRLLKEQI